MYVVFLCLTRILLSVRSDFVFLKDGDVWWALVKGKVIKYPNFIRQAIYWPAAGLLASQDSDELR
jgi:hypothetical protein